MEKISNWNIAKLTHLYTLIKCFSLLYHLPLSSPPFFKLVWVKIFFVAVTIKRLNTFFYYVQQATAGQDHDLRIWVLKDAYKYFDDMRQKFNSEGIYKKKLGYFFMWEAQIYLK